MAAPRAFRGTRKILILSAAAMGCGAAIACGSDALTPTNVGGFEQDAGNTDDTGAGTGVPDDALTSLDAADSAIPCGAPCGTNSGVTYDASDDADASTDAADAADATDADNG
jgi:hypothetical protein